ncbi:MraZ protein [Frankineae bacterium MT45]|nr:MraZ protein [Frankineae bacterium MT45]
MFLGTHTPRLDDKGRLALPAKFRAELDSGLVITKGQERCLFVFGIGEFGRLTDLLRTAPVTDRRARDYSRVFFASASNEVPDAQGRITVPQALRTYAGLTKECVVIGANTRVEIWDAVAWQSYLDSTEQAFAEAEEEVLPGLF